ncbi:MAG: VPLPA-CTERM sorting domain-containing protein [Pseudomonadota bacterium]
MKQTTLRAAAATCIALAPLHAGAVTFVLDFTSTQTLSTFTTTGFDSSGFSFGAATDAQIQNDILEAVREDFLDYPTSDIDPNSPLAPGKELDIDIVLGSGGVYTGTDPLYYFVGIGSTTSTTGLGVGFVGSYNNILQVGTTTAMTFTNNVANILNTQCNSLNGYDGLINSIVGTTSHEIGHNLSLLHPNVTATEPNPGESAYGILATGASPVNMPNSERCVDRAFSYDNFATLIDNVGTRDLPDTPAPVPLVGSGALLGSALLAFGAMRRRRQV